MRRRHFMGWRPHIHMGVMQDQIFHMDKFAIHPHGGNGVGKILPFDEAVFHRRPAYPLVQSCQRFTRARGGDEKLFDMDVRCIVNH
ncbi:hypothetical protein D3C80_1710090 [compost metagenome]